MTRGSYPFPWGVTAFLLCKKRNTTYHRRGGITIANHLNDHGVISPADYKRRKGKKYKNAVITETRPQWVFGGIDYLIY
jgi:hypothetical protein